MSFKATFRDLRSGLRLLGRFRHHRRKAALVMALGAISSALQLALPLSSIVIFNQALPNRDVRLLAELGLGLALVTALSLVTGYWESALGTVLRERLSLELQRDTFEQVQHLPIAFFKSHDSGYLLGRMINDAESAVDFPAGLTSLGRNLVWLGAALLLVPVMNPIIGLVTALAIPLYVALLISYNRRIKERFASVQEKTARVSRDLFESLTGIFETKANTRERPRARFYVHALADKMRSLVAGRIVMILANNATQAVVALVSLFMLIYGGAAVIRGTLTLGELVALSALVGYLLLPINGLVQQAFVMQRSLAAMDRVDEVLALAPEPRGGGLRPPGPALGRIHFDRVTFGYPGSEPILREVSFDVAPGETVLFIGPSGEGKSSLMSLLPRFAQPLSGEILLDGVPIERFDLTWLRQQIAFVSQETFLFSDSVFDNIRVGRVDASRAEVREAARLANALEFIEELPQGFDTRVGERGCRLSGGQRQRIAIARALLKQAPILVLDEATSAVDLQTESALYEALERLIEGRTTLVVAHHAEAFLQQIDRTVEVRDGRVREIDSFRPFPRTLAVVG